MHTLDDIVTEVSQDVAEQYRRRMRARLMQQPREWLVDQLLEQIVEEAGGAGGAGRAGEPGAPGEARPALAAQPAPPGLPASPGPPASPADDHARASRIRAMQLDEARLASLSTRWRPLDRDELEARGYLIAPPTKGATLIDADHRTRKGHALLREAKDLLHALLFADREAGVRFDRAHRELVTITVPHAKAWPLTSLLRAATVIDAEGSWQDPKRVADDDRRHNTLIQVEYGEVASEAVGYGITLALRLINDLEINEQVLYARIENIEESTLV